MQPVLTLSTTVFSAVRSTRRTVMRVYRDGAPFVVGQANLLADGTDVALIACLLAYFLASSL